MIIIIIINPCAAMAKLTLVLLNFLLLFLVMELLSHMSKNITFREK